MTTEAISSILSELNVSENTWTAIENKIPLLFLSQDGNIYPDDAKARFKFNSSKQILEIAYGSVQDGTFVSNLGETENYTPQAFISYDIIGGVIRSVYKGPFSTYYSIPFR